MGPTPNVILYQDSQVESPKILEIRTFMILKAHNFLCGPPIRVISKAKL